jgi:uncharacterized membrane protein
MQLNHTIAIHMSAAIAALAIGPLVLWARLGQHVRPWLHRALGYAWTTLMLVAAITAVFIRDFAIPNIWGYTPIHLLIPVTFLSLWKAFHALARREFEAHRKTMQSLYIGACVVAGAFTLLPSRYLGQLIWHDWLGWY